MSGTSRRSRARERSSRLGVARPQLSSGRATLDPGACLSHGVLVGGNSGNNGRPGGNRQGAHVSRAPKIAPVPAGARRSRPEIVGKQRMNGQDIRHRSIHEVISALMPWYVNGTMGVLDRQRVDSHLRICAACREELLQERRVCERVGTQVGVEYIPTPSLKRLNVALDGMNAGEYPLRKPPPAER